ncbi:MAG TPA: hypothetical protein VLJ39_16355, partial [Tepidisphaeraceae bacterium]|nr:hypothetical protein [Tepidisphaeraceae bacterium]
VQAKGNLDVAIVATSNASTVSLGTITRRVVINPQRRQQLLLVETLPANLPAGTYTLTGTVDPNNVFNAPTVTNNTFVDPFPLTVT